ncbi:hypothetical protein K474DRAFT_1712871 [Panus rudis PR-1116 ss-1]|nr:hypothetical protein K474DRAFT_1712871 [Panus rudis PR-1116 ss-1]
MSSRSSRSHTPKREEGAMPPTDSETRPVADAEGGGDYVKLEKDGEGMKVEAMDALGQDAAAPRDAVKEEDDLLKFEEDGDTIMGDPSNSHSSSSRASPSDDSKSHLSSLKAESGSRKSSTPPVSSKTKKKSEPQLIGHLPRAEEAAKATFTEIPANHYQYNTLGRSREAFESMTCDCQYEHGVDDPVDACGDGSDCINRLTQVECMPDDCRCGGYCQNQRFQRKEYAPIEIVQTEKKGFGLRAAQDLPKDTFIYEYVGDVVSHPSFLKRMRLYAEEGIRHFYFMMLQKDEFIDATKRGGIGRFANHSCNPNCYVAKWTVGDRVRMGIFASRKILKNEELTFNYNVDRYGHDAQPCYCGEPNCVGFIGGKTQTDIAAMDDLYLDALGITDEVEQLGLKGSKKKKSKKLDEDYMPTLSPLVDTDVPKVVQAMRQTQSRKVLLKLLTRIKITEDLSPLRQIMRLRGFSVMTNILNDYAQDPEILMVALECMMRWPLIQRNKVEDSKVNVPVKTISESENEALAGVAKKLLEMWDGLEYAYRIPKRVKGEDDPPVDSSIFVYQTEEDARPAKRPKSRSPSPRLRVKPLGYSYFQPPPTSYGKPIFASIPTPGFPSVVDSTPPPSSQTPPVQDRKIFYGRFEPAREDVATIIAAAAAAKAAEEEAARKAKEAAEREAAEKAARKEKEREKRKKAAASSSSSGKSHHMSAEEKEANKEKKLLKLVGAVVVKCMSKHKDQFDHDSFKKHAKELTQIIADKEKKSSSYKEGKLDSLSDEKVIKIKRFSKEYIAKVIRKMEKKGRLPSSSGHRHGGGEPSSSTLQSQADDSKLMDEALANCVGDNDSPQHASPLDGTPSSVSHTSHPSATPAPSSSDLPTWPNAGTSDHDWAGTISRTAAAVEAQ